MRSSRREFVRLSSLGLAAAASLGMGTTLTACSPTPPAKGMRRLRPADVELLRALIPAVLEGAVGADDAAALDAAVRSYDRLLDDSSDVIVDGTLLAFDVLENRMARWLSTGRWSGWHGASVGEAKAALDSLLQSDIGALNAIHGGLSDTLVMAWYATDAGSQSTGYPGPPRKLPPSPPGAGPQPGVAAAVPHAAGEAEPGGESGAAGIEGGESP